MNINRTLACIIGLLILTTFSAQAHNKVVVIPMGADGKIIGTEIKSLPYSASSPGFYYLASNLSTSTGGITVAANDVTIDFMGFRVTGPGKGAGGGYEGVTIDGVDNVEIRNGSVNSFPGHGIRGASVNNVATRILGMRIYDIGVNGISLSGFGHIVDGCTVFRSNFFGISSGGGAVVINNVVYQNGLHGISVNHSLVKNNTSYGNVGQNIIQTSPNNTIVDNYAP